MNTHSSFAPTEAEQHVDARTTALREFTIVSGDARVSSLRPVGVARPQGSRHEPAGEHERRPSVVVVDDDPGVLRSLGRLLALHGFDVQPFASPQSLLSEIERLAPACLVADLSMPGLSGLDLQRTLEERGLDYPIVFVTAYGDIQASVQAMRGGAVDFLTKPFDQRDLLDAVERAVATRESSRETSERLAVLRRRRASLTVREREVFDQVAAGYLNKQIAASLGISEKTVKVHRARVMRKMFVRSVAELARAAEQIDSGAITPSLPLHPPRSAAHVPVEP